MLIHSQDKFLKESQVALHISLCIVVTASGYYAGHLLLASTGVDASTVMAFVASAFFVSAALIYFKQRDSNKASQIDHKQHLLDNLRDGVFMFDEHGLISEERSAVLKDLLPATVHSDNLSDVLASTTEISANDVGSCLNLLWNKTDFFSDYQSSISMLPKVIHTKTELTQRCLHLDYEPVYDSAQKLVRILVTVADKTQQSVERASADAVNERMRRLSLAIANLEAYKSFLGEAIALIKNCDYFLRPQKIGAKKSLLKLDNHIHTLKGILGTFGYDELVYQIHDLESHLRADKPLEVHETMAMWSSIKDRWKFESSYIEETLHLKDLNNKIMIDKGKLKALRQLAEDMRSFEMLTLIKGFESQSIVELFRSHSNHLKDLCRRYPEKAVEVVLAPDSDEITHDDIRPLENVLTHIFRNCFDHGLGTKVERQAQGKSEVGQITVAAFLTDNQLLHLVIKDDGNGIDSDKLTQKAVEAGIWTPEKAVNASYQDKLNLIFSPSLSSKDEVTELSGRGVGMDAVADIVNGLGGKITVFSEKEVGTQFEIDIPTHIARMKIPA